MPNFAHKFKKQYGQNFLRSAKYARQLVAPLDITDQDVVVEIGPGAGVVTNLLLESPAALVVSIEIDYQLVPKLVEKFGENEKFELLHTDVMKLRWETPEFMHEHNLKLWQEAISGKRPLKLTGSLPYNISKRIILHALKYWPAFTAMCFIVQEEVALDYVAVPPKASNLSSLTRLRADVKKHRTIPTQEFFPIPKVGGGILEIRPKKEIDAERIEIAEGIVRSAFASPRKNLRNNLKRFAIPEEMLTMRAAEVDWVEFFAKHDAKTLSAK